MHVAVDAHNLLSDRRGIGVFVRALLRDFAHRDSVRMTLLVNDWWPRLHQRDIADILGSARFALARRVPREADVLWSPWNGTFFNASVPRVATIHDCAPFALPNSDVRAREREQAPFRRTAASATLITTDSTFSATEIARCLSVAPERIRVVPLAVDEIYTRGEPANLPQNLQPQRYVLVVGAADARKNRATLVSAWRKAAQRCDIALACVGGERVESAVHLTDLTQTQLRDLYRGALALAMPSTYEGFGLPALEALACGTPVIASRAASLPEVCGDAALYVDDPLDVAAWARAIERLATDATERARLVAQAAPQAEKFSWKKTADATLAVLEEAATRPPWP